MPCAAPVTTATRPLSSSNTTDSLSSNLGHDLPARTANVPGHAPPRELPIAFLQRRDDETMLADGSVGHAASVVAGALEGRNQVEGIPEQFLEIRLPARVSDAPVQQEFLRHHLWPTRTSGPREQPPVRLGKPIHHGGVHPRCRALRCHSLQLRPDLVDVRNVPGIHAPEIHATPSPAFCQAQPCKTIQRPPDGSATDTEVPCQFGHGSPTIVRLRAKDSLQQCIRHLFGKRAHVGRNRFASTSGSCCTGDPDAPVGEPLRHSLFHQCIQCVADGIAAHVELARQVRLPQPSSSRELPSTDTVMEEPEDLLTQATGSVYQPIDAHLTFALPLSTAMIVF